jgi:hypothetical protein
MKSILFQINYCSIFPKYIFENILLSEISRVGESYVWYNFAFFGTIVNGISEVKTGIVGSKEEVILLRQNADGRLCS